MVKVKLIKEKDGKELPKDKWHFIEMSKGYKATEEEKQKKLVFYIDGILKNNLNNIKKTIKQDWDYVFIIDGEVGAGKSKLGKQICYYLSDGDFDVDEVVFNPKDFKTQVLKSKKYNAIQFDEAFRGMSSRAAMSQTNKVLMAMLQEIRQRNLFIFIVLPSIWDLDKFVALHRCKGLIHVYTDESKTRGFFRFYPNKESSKGGSKFKSFFHDSKNKYKYPHRCLFSGRFTNFDPLDVDLYDKKKSDALGDYGYGDKEKNSKVQDINLAFVMMGLENNLSLQDISKKRGFNEAWARKVLSNAELTQESAIERIKQKIAANSLEK